MTDNSLNWDIVSETTDKAQLEEQNKAQYEENIHFQRTFTSPNGKKVLEWLTKYTLETPTWWPGQDTSRGFFREGQNSLVRQIISKIEQAKNYQEKK